MDYKLEIKLFKTRIEFLENKKSEEQRLIEEEIQKTVKERENLPSTPLSRLTDDDTSKNNSDEEISDDEAAEEVTEEPDTAAKINLLIDLSTEDSLVADDLLNERNESIEESIENVSEKSGSNNQFSRQKTTIEVHLKVLYILIISLKMQWRTILCKVSIEYIKFKWYCATHMTNNLVSFSSPLIDLEITSCLHRSHQRCYGCGPCPIHR